MQFHQAKKMFGQNFLVDKNIIGKIIQRAALTKDDVVLEIGPGKGSLTDSLLESLKDGTGVVFAIEIDRGLCAFLRGKYRANPKFVLLEGDCLKLPWNTSDIKPTKLIANIPYNITSQIIFKMFEYHKNFDKVILMMQDEVAERIVSKHDTKVYGVLSCLIQKFWTVEKFYKLPASVFKPAPKVESALVEFVPKRFDCSSETLKRYIDFVKFCFMQRRKVLFARLVKEYSVERGLLTEFYQKHDLNVNIRPENISVDLMWELFLFLKPSAKY